MSITIGRNFHIVHMTGDLKALDAWYYDVFSVQRFMPDSYMPAEKRDASLVVLGDLCMEPLAPAFSVDGWDTHAPWPVLPSASGPGSTRWPGTSTTVWTTCTTASGKPTSGSSEPAGVKQEGDTPQGAVFTHPTRHVHAAGVHPHPSRRAAFCAIHGFVPGLVARMVGRSSPAPPRAGRRTSPSRCATSSARS